MFQINCISNEYKLNFNFKTLLAYEIFNILKKLQTHNN